MEETEVTPLPGDLVHEILLRVPTDEVAALFRCALTCKQWHDIVADPSFLRHHWPENVPHPSSLLGFFDTRSLNRGPPFFFPASPGRPVLSAWLASFVALSPPAPGRGVIYNRAVPGPGDIFNRAVPLAARGGLLVMRLATGRLAVCNVLTGACDVLPPLQYTVSHCGCVILTREDCCSSSSDDGQTPSTGVYSAFFKLLVIARSYGVDDCNLYTFSSSDPNWSQPRNCWDEVWKRDTTSGLRIMLRPNRVILCRGVVYWLCSYSTDDQWGLPPRDYFTFGVDVNTGQMSLTEISIPANQLASIPYFGLHLSVAVDGGKLSLFHLQKEDLLLNTWTRGDDGLTWLRTRVIQLRPPPGHAWNPRGHVCILSGEKNGVLFITDVYGRVHKTDPETGVMKDVTAQGSFGILAVPIEIDWHALFMSRLSLAI